MALSQDIDTDTSGSVFPEQKERIELKRLLENPNDINYRRGPDYEFILPGTKDRDWPSGEEYTISNNGSVFDNVRLAGDPPSPDSKPPVQQAAEGVISATVTEGPNAGRDVTPDPHPTIPHPYRGAGAIVDLFNPEKLEKEAELTAENLRTKMEADRKADQSGAMQYHRRQMEAASNAQAHELGNMPPPWDAAQKSAEMIRGPFESFGSFASILALAASAFTKQPALNALSASAAAMTAIHQSDALAYERAYTAWKDNTELVQKRFNMEKQLFDNASHLFDKDQALWKAKLVENAARFGDQHMLNLLNAGLDGDAIKLWSDRSRAFEESVKAANSVEELEGRRKFINSAVQQAEEDHPILQPGETTTPDKDPWTEAQHAHYKLLLTQEARAKDDRQEFVAREVRQYFNEHGEMPKGAAYAKIIEEAHSYGHGRGGNISDQQFISKFYEEHPDATVEQFSEAFGKFKAGQKPGSTKPLSKSQQDVQIAELLASGDPEKVEQANKLIEKRHEVATKTAPGEDYDDITIKHMAAQYLLGNKSVLQNVRGGARMQDNQRKIRNEIARQQEEQGLSDEEVNTRQAEFTGLNAAERTLYMRAANIAVSASEAEIGLQIARDYNRTVPREKFVPWNRLTLMSREQISDPKVWGLKQALTTLINQYANVISRSGVATVHDKTTADKTFTGVTSPQALEEVFRVVEREILAAKRAPIEARKQFRKGLEGTEGKESPNKVINYDNQGNRIAD